MSNRIKVLIVDDSAVVRQVVEEILLSDPGIEVIGKVSDPIFAMRRMEKEWPDVIVLDIEMPRMDGITFMRKLMSEHPTPVVICSTLTGKGAQTTMDAMSAGAVDIITKPKVGLKDFLHEEKAHFIQSVRGAAQARMRKVAQIQADTTRRVPPKRSADAVIPAGGSTVIKSTTDKVVAIGTSTGGTQALEAVLTRLPRIAPGIVIVQHMPEHFTRSFADRLNDLCQIEVREAVDGDRIIPGRALIAPGGHHMVVKRSGAKYHAEIKDGPVVNRHRPSVDVLFRSAAQAAGKNVLGIIMTGMGDDGAAGIQELHGIGAPTIAQDEETCVVFGMPQEAIKRGGIDTVLPLDRIADAILRYGATADKQDVQKEVG